MKALINVNIFDYVDYRKDQYILFDKQIREVGSMDKFEGCAEVYDLEGSLVMPSLVVGHTHIYSTFARGMNVPFNPRSFKELLEQLWWKLDKELDNEATYQSALVSGVEFIKNGVTTVFDHHASGRDILGSLENLKRALCEEMGLRGIFCVESSERFTIEDCIKENINFSRKNKSTKCAGMFGMHASMSLSDKSLYKIKNLIDDFSIHMHVAESLQEQQNCASNHKMRVVERLDNFGLINKDSILAHCIHINEKEASIIAKNKAGIVVNPTSNMNNGVGLPDYNLFKEYGIDVMLGNDGLGYNMARESMNLLFCIKHKFKSPTAFSLDDLQIVLQNNYKKAAEMLGIKLGRIREGYEADMVVMKYIPPTIINKENAFSHIFFGLFDNFSPTEVLCGGKFLMRKGKVNVNENEIYEGARKVSEKIWKRLS